MTNKDGEQSRRESEERKLEEIVCYFRKKAGEGFRRHGLKIEKGFTIGDELLLSTDSVSYYYPNITVLSRSKMLRFMADLYYSIRGEDCDTSKIEKNSERESKVLSALLKDDPNNVKEYIRSIAQETVPFPRLEGLDLHLVIPSKSRYLENVFTFALGDSVDVSEIRSLPIQENYRSKEEFERELRDWQNFYFPAIQRYGSRFNEILVLGKNLDISKKAIDLGFEICQDEELDEQLSKAGEEK